MEEIKERIPSRDSAPFIFDIGSRVLKGAAVGMVTGLIFTKRWRSRKFLAYYGAGFGLGMSYT